MGFDRHPFLWKPTDSELQEDAMDQGNKLTERELLIAKQAAKIAVQEIQDEFYKQVGRGIMTRLFIWLGLAAVAFSAGKGWISFK